jgi:hypothetical protein
VAPPAGLAPVAAPVPAPEPMARVASPGGGPGDGSLVPSALAAMAKGFKDQRRSVVYCGLLWFILVQGSLSSVSFRNLK